MAEYAERIDARVTEGSTLGLAIGAYVGTAAFVDRVIGRLMITGGSAAPSVESVASQAVGSTARWSAGTTSGRTRPWLERRWVRTYAVFSRPRAAVISATSVITFSPTSHA